MVDKHSIRPVLHETIMIVDDSLTIRNLVKKLYCFGSRQR